MSPRQNFRSFAFFVIFTGGKRPKRSRNGRNRKDKIIDDKMIRKIILSSIILSIKNSAFLAKNEHFLLHQKKTGWRGLPTGLLSKILIKHFPKKGV
jgi:hypothetical protein